MRRGVSLCSENYYDDLLERVGEIDEDVGILKKHSILIDRDDEAISYSYLPSQL